MEKVKPTKGQRTKQKVYQAVAKIVSRKGAQSLTVRAIAKELKMSVGGIQFHVPCIEDIIFETVQYIYEQLPKEDFFPPEDLNGLDYLLAIADLNFDIFTHKNDYYGILLYSYYQTSSDKRFAELYKTHLKKVTKKISEKVRIRLKSKESIDDFSWECACLIEGSILFSHIGSSPQRNMLKKILRKNYQNFCGKE